MRNIYVLLRFTVFTMIVCILFITSSFAQKDYVCGDIFSNTSTGGQNSYTFTPPEGERIILIRTGSWSIGTGGSFTLDGTAYTNANYPAVVYGDVDEVLYANVTFGTGYTFNFDVKIGKVYESTGSTSLIVPSWVSSIDVLAWGGGGGGGEWSGGRARGGGGGGAFTAGTISGLTGGSSSVSITVGAGGAAGNSNSGSNSVVSFGASTITANGGGGAIGNTSASPAPGGTGGAASPIGGIITASYAGGSGGTGYNNSGNGGGGGGGSSPSNIAAGVVGSNGQSDGTGGAGGNSPLQDTQGNGGRGADNDGNPVASNGFQPGGGGGGQSDDSENGGDGASGRVIITYACPPACTPGTWDGSASSDWNTAANWCNDQIPTSGTNVTIPDVATDPAVSATDAACDDLTIESGAVLTINAGGALTVGGTITNIAGATGLVIKSTSEGATGTGSLITSSAVSATVERYMSEDVWHIVSSPVSNQSISGFLTNTGNPIIYYGDPDYNYDMIEYNETSDDWSDFFTASTPGNMVVAKGYSVVPQENDAAVFSGTLNAGNISSPAVTRNGQGWNCIGNPYPSAISVNSFLTNATNDPLIDDNYYALYLWDEGSGYTGSTFEYIALSNITVNLPWVGDKIAQTQVALGQGFIIRKAASGSANFSFTPSMRVISTDAVFKDAFIPWPALQLFVSPKNAELKSSTIVAINDQMTKGLDPGYDVGMLKANPEFALYTRLVNDNKGVDFTIQCLPVDADYEQNPYRIPVGIDFKDGGEVTFTARFAGFPQGTPVYLEDKLLQKTVDITQEGASYSTTVAAGAKGIGRFYLHGSSKLVTSINQLPVNEYLIYTIGKAIVVNGDFSPDTRLVLFSVDGRILYDGRAGSRNQCRIDANHLPSGVYLLSITDNGQRQTKKIVLGQN